MANSEDEEDQEFGFLKDVRTKIASSKVKRISIICDKPCKFNHTSNSNNDQIDETISAEKTTTTATTSKNQDQTQNKKNDSGGFLSLLQHIKITEEIREDASTSSQVHKKDQEHSQRGVGAGAKANYRARHDIRPRHTAEQRLIDAKARKERLHYHQHHDIHKDHQHHDIDKDHRHHDIHKDHQDFDIHHQHHEQTTIEESPNVSNSHSHGEKNPPPIALDDALSNYHDKICDEAEKRSHKFVPKSSAGTALKVFSAISHLDTHHQQHDEQYDEQTTTEESPNVSNGHCHGEKNPPLIALDDALSNYHDKICGEAKKESHKFVQKSSAATALKVLAHIKL